MLAGRDRFILLCPYLLISQKLLTFHCGHLLTDRRTMDDRFAGTMDERKQRRFPVNLENNGFFTLSVFSPAE